MFDKILIGAGILLGSILIIENIVTGYNSYVFLDTSASTGTLAIVCILVGAMIGYGIRGFFSKSKDSSEDDYDF